LTVTLLVMASPIAEALNVDTTATILVTPDPIGVGQIMKFMGDINPNPTYPLVFHDIRFIITYPDETDVIIGPVISNTDGGVTINFVPTIVGSYSVNFTFPGETLSDGHYYGPCEAVTDFVVQNEPFTFNPTSPEVGQTVTFDASSSSSFYGTIIDYAWDFGDGNTDTGMTACHAYTLTGNYTVTLTVTDSYALTDNITRAVTVIDSLVPPVASFTFNPSAPEVDETVIFDASGSSDSDGNIVSYEWEFGEQTTGSGVTSTHAYSSEGNYTVTLTVTDNDELTNTTTKTITLIPKPLPPEASFTFSPASPEVNETVTFDASNSSDLDGTIINYVWNFGDENTGTGVTVSHSYASTGTYTVTLIVTDNDLLTNTTTKSITVSPPAKEAPEASFTYSPPNPEVSETITFDASGSSDPDGMIINYIWDFGDGTTGAGMTVTHSYTLDGTYTVTLTVTDNDALTGTTTKTISNVIPEFPSWIIMPLFMAATFSAVMVYRRLTKKASKS